MVINLFGKGSENLRTFLGQFGFNVIHAISENGNTLKKVMLQ